MGQPRVVLQIPGKLIAVPARYADVGEHDIRRGRIDAPDCLVAVGNRHDVDIMIGKDQLDHALDRDALVGEQKSMHGLVIGSNTVLEQARRTIFTYARVRALSLMK